ncbi:hypothetical protein Hanom_Chr02g00151221 [Helianthus anomalus]
MSPYKRERNVFCGSWMVVGVKLEWLVSRALHNFCLVICFCNSAQSVSYGRSNKTEY